MLVLSVTLLQAQRVHAASVSALMPMQTACATVEKTTAGSAMARMRTYLVHGDTSGAVPPQ